MPMRLLIFSSLLVCFMPATLYQDLLVRGELPAYEVSQRFYEVGSFVGLEEIRQYLAGSPRPGQKKRSLICLLARKLDREELKG